MENKQIYVVRTAYQKNFIFNVDIQSYNSISSLYKELSDQYNLYDLEEDINASQSSIESLSAYIRHAQHDENQAIKELNKALYRTYISDCDHIFIANSEAKIRDHLEIAKCCYSDFINVLTKQSDIQIDLALSKLT